MKNDIESLEDELDSLSEEIKDTHNLLTRLGVGKEHWGLPGRIHALLLVLKTKTPQEINELCQKEGIVK